MVGNANAVTEAPARTPAPTVQKPALPASPSGAPAGKTSPVAGGSLPPPEPPVSRVEIELAVQRLLELTSETQRSLRFQIDELSGRTVITVVDETTKEIVRQIPSPELLAVMRHLERVGALLDTQG
jgi:flagellar protein FlaG